MRKKTVSLIVVLTFLFTLFPMALPAFAADYNRLGAVVSVEDDVNVELNRVRGEFTRGELQKGASVIIGLPNDFEFVGGVGKDDSSDNYIELSYEDDPGVIDYDVEFISDNEVKLVIDKDYEVLTSSDIDMFITLGKVYVDDGFDGDIPLTFEVATGGFDEGSVVVGRVTGGEVTVSVVDDSNFGDGGGEVTLRIREDRAGALDKDDESVKLTLPRGFEWASSPTIRMIDGDVGYYSLSVYEDELRLKVTDKSTQAVYIEIIADIVVEDETRAEYGEVVARVGGESDVTPSTLVVGVYGDYEVDVTADDPTTVYAGMLEQEIADITLKEGIGDSLVGDRAVTLTLPEWAKWGALDESYDDGSKAELNRLSFPGRDGQVAKYMVVEGNDSRATIDLEDMEVVLSPDAPEGDLEVEITGSAGVRATVKVAEVKKPVDVAVESYPVIGIGKADQAIGEITITEAEAEMIIEKQNLVLELPKDVDWDEYDVEVTEGNLELGRVTANDNFLTIRIDRDSSEASTITVTGSVTAYRSVPEGRVNVEVGGPAVIEVNDTVELPKYYDGIDSNDALKIDGVPAIAEKEWDEGLWADEDTVAEVQVATVGTPAPGDQKITAVFTLGSTNYVLNDEEQTMDVAPYAKNGRTYLPMRYVANALGIPSDGILWHNGTATFISADRVVSVTIGSNVMYINGAAVQMDVAPEISNGRTMLPIRWIATAFGVAVDWNAETQEVTVNP